MFRPGLCTSTDQIEHPFQRNWAPLPPYVDYTGPEAQDRQRIILQSLAPKKNNRVTERQLKDGSAKYTPRSNKECVSLSNKLTLQPGEELYAMADHGSEGQITILEKDS